MRIDLHIHSRYSHDGVLEPEEIVRLEQRIQSNRGTEEELAEIKKQLMELYGPIDDLFKDLKRRIGPKNRGHGG